MQRSEWPYASNSQAAPSGLESCVLFTLIKLSTAGIAQRSLEGDGNLSLTVQAPAAPAEGQRPGMTMRQRSQAALSGLESSGLVTLTESAEDAAGEDDAEMEEEVVGEPVCPMAIPVKATCMETLCHKMTLHHAHEIEDPPGLACN